MADYQSQLKQIPWVEIAEFLFDNPSAYGTVLGIIDNLEEQRGLQRQEQEGTRRQEADALNG